MRLPYLGIAVFLFLSLLAPNTSAEEPDTTAVKNARIAIAEFQKTDKGLEGYFAESYGYAVFPNVGKGAFGIGGAHGNGIVFVGDEPVAKSELIQVTVGLQFGGQSYREILFFETEESFKSFQEGELKLSGQASAVAVTLGASANLKYNGGIAIVTMAKGGLMYEASIGGQHFSYEPFAAAAKENPPAAADSLETKADSTRTVKAGPDSTRAPAAATDSTRVTE